MRHGHTASFGGAGLPEKGMPVSPFLPGRCPGKKIDAKALISSGSGFIISFVVVLLVLRMSPQGGYCYDIWHLFCICCNGKRRVALMGNAFSDRLCAGEEILAFDGRFNMKRILLVEDDAHLQFLIKEELSEEGYEVTIASDGMEALSMLQADGAPGPDLIILDIRMPRMDGFETMGHIIKSRVDAPIILHSAFSGYRNHPLSMAADAYVVKSHDFSGLKKAVNDLLNAQKGLRDSIPSREPGVGCM